MQLNKITKEDRYFKEAINMLYNWWKDRKDTTYEKDYNHYLESLKDDNLPNLYALIINDTLIAVYEINEKDGVDNAPYTPYIASIFVKEEYRGRGLLNVIMEDAFSKIKALGYDKAYVHSRIDGLYEKYGFKQIDTVDTKDGKKRIFEKEL